MSPFRKKVVPDEPLSSVPDSPHRSAVALHPRACPALWAAILCAAGIAAAATSAWDALWFLPLAIGPPLVVVFLPRNRRLVSLRNLILTVVTGVAAFGLGAFRQATTSNALPPDHIARLIPHGSPTDILCLSGRMADEAVPTPSGYRFRLDVDSAATRDAVHPLSGIVQVLVRSDTTSASRGSLVGLCGRLRAPPEPRNPADFDYGRYLRHRDVHAVLDAETELEILDRAAPRPVRLLSLVQRHIQASIDRYGLTPGSRAVLSSLILGRKSDLDAQTREDFAATGLSHLLAISGLHVLLVGMVLHGLLRPVLVRFGLRWSTVEWLRASATLLLLVTYAILCGGGPSVWRAVTMTAVFLAGGLIQRKPSAMNSLGFAAFILLLMRPNGLFDIGFQLSFAAVSGIVLLRPSLPAPELGRSRAASAMAGVVESVSVSLAATLATAPVLLFHFGRVAFAGLLLNVPGIPLTAGVLTSGLLSLVFSPVSPWMASAMGAAATFLAEVLTATARFGARSLAWVSAVGYVRSPLLLLAMLCSLLGLVFRRGRRHGWPLHTAAIACLALHTVLRLLSGHARPALDLFVFDVGHGDALLVRYPNGNSLLVDTGARSAYVDHGIRTILPQLDHFGIDAVDAVVLTHPHGDHIGGTESLLREHRIKSLYTASASTGDANYRRIRSVADSAAVPFHLVSIGDSLLLDQRVPTQLVWPPPAPAGHGTNNTSIVLRLRFGRTTLLLLGDAESDSEDILCTSLGHSLQADIVKVGHHGSRTSSSPCFVDLTRPKWALVSVGRPQTYGLPDEEIIQRWEDSGSIVLSTFEQRALWFRSDGRRFRRVAW